MSKQTKSSVGNASLSAKLADQPKSREGKKAYKRQRIKAAAKDIFAVHGFENTNLREIAQAAGVALGTLSLYARDKRDLILLMFNDEMAEIIEKAGKEIDEQNEFLTNIMGFFETFYREFGSNVILARTFLQQNFFFSGINTSALAENEAQIVRHLCRAIIIARGKSEVRLDEDVEILAQSIYLTYVASVRLWISEERPVPKRGIAHLHRLLLVQIRGLSSES